MSNSNNIWVHISVFPSLLILFRILVLTCILITFIQYHASGYRLDNGLSFLSRFMHDTAQSVMQRKQFNKNYIKVVNCKIDKFFRKKNINNTSLIPKLFHYLIMLPNDICRLYDNECKPLFTYSLTFILKKNMITLYQKW
jgi:hypothetical protein